MSRIAIIGTGIAGMGCGHFLHKTNDITLFEQASHIGGHTYTVTVDEDGTSIPIDVGFIVYNEVTYPNLTRLFKELNVPTKDSSMSFSVNHVPSGLSFCGSGLNGLFGQRSNLLRPSFYRLLAQINAFNREAPGILQESSHDLTLGAFVSKLGLGNEFLEKYLIPMSAAVWSMTPERMLEFPAATLVRFFRNHGFLGLNTQHQWKTVDGGSWAYRDRLIAPFRTRIRERQGAVRVIRGEKKVTVVTTDGSRQDFDKVILACHADQALRLLDDPLEQEARLLGAFRYQTNSGTLHTDAGIMPGTRRLWSSWNYRIDRMEDGRLAASTTYHMNSLQRVSDKKQYFVTIDDPGIVRDDAVLRTFTYEHPIFTREAIQAQTLLPSLNERGPVYFCGSYFANGFHEDAFTSALHVSRALVGESLWR